MGPEFLYGMSYNGYKRFQIRGPCLGTMVWIVENTYSELDLNTPCL